MDFYAMQLTPRKKDDEKEKRAEQLKKFREHIVTKEEILTEIKPRLGSALKEQKDGGTEAQELGKTKSISPDFLSPKSFSLPGKEVSKENPEDVKADKDRQEIKQAEKGKEILAKNYNEDTWSPSRLSAKVEIGKERPTPTQEVGKKISESAPKVEDKNSQAKDEDLAENFVEAILADDLKKVNDVIERLIAFRSQSVERAEENLALNGKLKEKLIAAIPSLFAYKSGKNVLHVFQLLDELSLKFTDKDLDKLPDEILKSAEMKSVCEKYLIWFAREYPDSPALLQDRIYFFNKCGILAYQEIKGFSGLQLAINSDLVNFIKAKVSDPHEVERKIYEFALAGLVDEKAFKQENKVRDIVRRFIGKLAVFKRNKPSETAKKIDEYEKMGLIKASEILASDQIGKVIERYLIKYKRENREHPRKAATLVKEYYNAGLIDKEMRDKLA